MTDYEEYFVRLRSRKRVGLWYRDLWLYPRICRYLNGKALDIGCGIGDMVRYRPHTIGVDVNPKAVAFCQSQGLQVHQMQADRLPFPDAGFDGAILDNVLEHLASPDVLLAEIHRVVRSEGSLIVGVPGECGFASDPDHKRHYSEAELIRCVRGSGFEPLHVFHQPFRSRLLDRHFRYYAIYGVFRRTQEC
jgi:SAM-dependent methyltransferase